MAVNPITDLASYNVLIKNAGSKLVMIDFHAQWCGPCKMISPEVENLAREFANEIVVLKCDVDECSDVAQQFEINCMPTFVFLKDGSEVERFSGANKEKLRGLLVSLK